MSEWDEFEWSKRAIHISVQKQAKWCALVLWYFLKCLDLEGDFKSSLIIFTSRWYAKRFLHPDIVAPYEYIFIWDEDLGVEHFNAEEYAFNLHLNMVFHCRFF